MLARKLTLVEIGAGALPSLSPPTRRFSTWFPVAHKAVDVPAVDGVTPKPVADGVLIEWAAVDQAGVIYVIERGPSQQGPWTEIHRTVETRYLYSDGSGEKWFFRITPTVRGKAGSGAIVGATPPATSAGLEEQRAKLAAETIARMDADAAEAAARAAGLSQAARDLLAEAAVRQKADSVAMDAITAEGRERAMGLLNEKMAREAAITQEQQTRQSDVESLSRAISEVVAGNGAQFDSKLIWYFDSSAEGWTGNGAPTVVDGWLRPANAAALPWVQSPPALSVDGSDYRFVKLRVKRVGAPAWAGSLQWITAADRNWNAQKRVVMPEPTWDENGVAVLDVPDVAWWPGVVDALRLQLGSAQAVANYYLIDWVAIGRPTPGASVAMVRAEEEARITAVASEASQRNTLAVQMRGDYTGNDLAKVTQGFMADERIARVAADSAQVGRLSAMEVRMPAGSGAVATAASVTAEQQARVAGDAANAGEISQVKAQLPALMNQGTSLVLNGSFEHGGDVGWTYSGAAMSNPANEGRAGGRCWRVDPGTGVRIAFANGSRPIPVVPGKKYRYSCWYRTSADYNGTPNNGKMRLATQGNTLIGSSPPFLPSQLEWTYLERVFGVPASTSITGFLLQYSGDNTEGTLWVDDASLDEVTEVLALAEGQQALSARVSNAEGTLLSQSEAITSLGNRVGGVESGTAANTTAIGGLTGRVSAAEGRIEAQATQATALASNLTALNNGGVSMFPLGTFESYTEGQQISYVQSTRYVARASARYTGGMGCDVSVEAVGSGNADTNLGQPIPVGAGRTLFVEYYVRLRQGSPPAGMVFRTGLTTTRKDGSAANWPMVAVALDSLVVDAWTRVSGYVTTNASAEVGRIILSIPTMNRTAGVRFDLDDIRITDVTDAAAAKQSADASATAVQGLSTKVTALEGTTAATSQQVTELASGIKSIGGDNLLLNSSFETSQSPTSTLPDWFASTNLAQAVSYGSAYAVTGSDRAIQISQITSATTAAGQYIGIEVATANRPKPLPGEKYTLSVWASRMTATVGNLQLLVQWLDGNNAGIGGSQFQQFTDLSAVMKRFSATFTAPTGAASVRIFVRCASTAAGQWMLLALDNASFQEGQVATAWAPSGRQAMSELRANANAIAGLSTTVTQQGTKIDATAQDLTRLSTQVGDVSASSFNQLQSQVTQQGQSITSNAQAIQGVQASVAGKADAAVVQTMQAQVNNQGAGGNLIANSTFPNWSGATWASPAGWTGWGDLAGSSYLPLGMVSGLNSRFNGNYPVGSRAWGWTTYNVPVVAGRTYCLSMYVSAWRHEFNHTIEWFNAAGQSVGNTWSPTIHNDGLISRPIADWPRPYLIEKAPPGAVSARITLMFTGTGEADPYIWIVRPMFSEVAAGATAPPPWSAGGGESSARWGVDVRADGRVGGIALSVTGQVAAFDVVSDMFRVSSPGNAGQRTEYSDGNWRGYDAAGRLRARWGSWT